jgi:hypothetical protein
MIALILFAVLITAVTSLVAAALIHSPSSTKQMRPALVPVRHRQVRR